MDTTGSSVSLTALAADALASMAVEAGNISISNTPNVPPSPAAVGISGLNQIAGCVHEQGFSCPLFTLWS